MALGEPRFDDDQLRRQGGGWSPPPRAVVSFTFGCRRARRSRALQDAGSEAWITVTSPQEARAAAELGPDALIVQGVEAGGHRGVFADDERASDLTLLVALQLVRARCPIPLVATGGLTTGAAIGAALVAGARAAQVGTAYMRAPEAGTSPRSATRSPPTRRPA